MILIVSVSLIVLSMNSVIADSTIPQWIRNNAKYWSTGVISDAEYLQGIQYLISQGIIQVTSPVKQVIATNGSPSDNDRVTSIVVHFQNLANVPKEFPSEIKITTFQRLYQIGQTTSGFDDTGQQTYPKVNPQFQLVDLPSKDKTLFYKLLNSIFYSSQNLRNSDKPKFDVLIDLYTGDGTLLHTLRYEKCTVITSLVITNSDKEDYRMNPTSQDAELREATNFSCQGYYLVFPSK
jgi:hypothetical protein